MSLAACGRLRRLTENRLVDPEAEARLGARLAPPRTRSETRDK